jgi:hypothetical protein
MGLQLSLSWPLALMRISGQDIILSPRWPFNKLFPSWYLKPSDIETIRKMKTALRFLVREHNPELVFMTFKSDLVADRLHALGIPVDRNSEAHRWIPPVTRATKLLYVLGALDGLAALVLLLANEVAFWLWLALHVPLGLAASCALFVQARRFGGRIIALEGAQPKVAE